MPCNATPEADNGLPLLAPYTDYEGFWWGFSGIEGAVSVCIKVYHASRSIATCWFDLPYDGGRLFDDVVPVGSVYLHFVMVTYYGDR